VNASIWVEAETGLMITTSKDHSTKQNKKKPLSRLVRMIAFAMLVSALRREISKPAAERTWHGKVWQVVPYDFRPPTWARFRERMWAPDTPELITPNIFGVGWTVNLGRTYAVLTSILRPEDGQRPSSG
jgi:uncharacterized membrane protein